MTHKQIAFCNEYLIDLNATQAAIRAGYSQNTAAEIGHENLRKPHIEKYIQERREEAQKRNEITLDKVIKEIGKVALFDIRSIYKEDGVMLQPHELSDEAAVVVSGFKSRREIVGSGEDKEVNFIDEYKTYDKTKALDMLMKHFGGYEKDKEQPQESDHTQDEISKAIADGLPD